MVSGVAPPITAGREEISNMAKFVRYGDRNQYRRLYARAPSLCSGAFGIILIMGVDNCSFFIFPHY